MCECSLWSHIQKISHMFSDFIVSKTVTLSPKSLTDKTLNYNRVKPILDSKTRIRK